MRYVKARLGPSELMVVTKKRRRKWVTSRLLPWLRRFVSRIFVFIWRCFKQLVCTLTSQVIAAASKPPEVNPFLQDYMDDMDQNLILCRYSPQTQSVRNFYQGAQLTYLTSLTSGILASGPSTGTDPWKKSSWVLVISSFTLDPRSPERPFFQWWMALTWMNIQSFCHKCYFYANACWYSWKWCIGIVMTFVCCAQLEHLPMKLLCQTNNSTKDWYYQYH